MRNAALAGAAVIALLAIAGGPAGATAPPEPVVVASHARVATMDGVGFLRGDGNEDQVVAIALPAGDYALLAKGTYLATVGGRSGRCSLQAGDDTLDTIFVDGGASPFVLAAATSLPTAGEVRMMCDSFTPNASIFRPRIVATQVGAIN